MYLFAVLIGIVAGSRAFTAPAAVSWAARLGRLDLSGTWLAFMGLVWTPLVFTALALVELVVDQLPSTPSRLVPMQFGARLVSGAVSGASVVGTTGSIVGGALVGILGRRYRYLRISRAADEAGGSLRTRYTGSIHRRCPRYCPGIPHRRWPSLTIVEAIIIGAVTEPSLAAQLTGGGDVGRHDRAAGIRW